MEFDHLGIVSKAEHCKGHIVALNKIGVEGVVLGPDITTIPPNFDVVVVRKASCSHGAFDVAKAWGKKDGNTLIVSNGVTPMLRKVRNLKGIEEPTEEESKAESRPTAREMVETFIKDCGVFTMSLLHVGAYRAANALRQLGYVKGEKGRNRAAALLEEMFEYDASTVRKRASNFASANAYWNVTYVYSPEGQRSFEVVALFRDQPTKEQAQDLAKMFGWKLEKFDYDQSEAATIAPKPEPKPKRTPPPKPKAKEKQKSRKDQFDWPDKIEVGNYGAVPNYSASLSYTDAGEKVCSWSLRRRSPSKYLTSTKGTAAEIHAKLIQMQADSDRKAAEGRKRAEDRQSPPQPTQRIPDPEETVTPAPPEAPVEEPQAAQAAPETSPLDNLKATVAMLKDELRAAGLQRLQLDLTPDTVNVFKAERVVVETFDIDLD